MERRKFTRFRAQDDSFAALRGNLSKVGKICDVSLNGLAFRYLSEKMSEETFNRVDIFLSNNGFHLDGLPCKVIYDETVGITKSDFVSSYRCGVKFKQISDEQQSKLEFFINNHTTGDL